MDRSNPATPMSLLLIEDDIIECKKYQDCAKKRKDITFVGITGSCEDGLHYALTSLPEGIILDLMLHEGHGSGLQFLSELQYMDSLFRPLIIVTTYISSPVICSHILEAGVDFIFHKNQSGYNPDIVIDTFLVLRKTLYATRCGDKPPALRAIESPEGQKMRISKKIDYELKLIGINVRYKGHAYLHDAIYYLICQKKGDTSSVIEQVAQDYNRDYSSVIRSMQTAIKSTWNSSSLDDLINNYRARINSDILIPTASEFIHYYADKIREYSRAAEPPVRCGESHLSELV